MKRIIHCPKTRTDILKTLYTLLGQRSAIKTSGTAIDENEAFENTLSKLGKLAWDALERDELILERVRVKVLVFKSVFTSSLHISVLSYRKTVMFVRFCI